MTPAFSVYLDGGDITGKLTDRLVKLQLIEFDGHETDTLQITLDDRDFSIEDPPTGAPLSVSIGYRETGLVYKGIFIVDEVEVDGPPFEMKIHAKAADQLAAQKQHRTIGYEDKTLGQIVKQIAGRYGLKVGISDKLSSIKYPYLNQTEESDWHLLTRLSHNHDALFSIKNGYLMFMDRADKGSLSGLPMPEIFVMYPGNLIRYRAMMKDRPRHAKTKAHWHDHTKGEVEVEEADSTGTDNEAEYTVRHIHPNKELAKAAAKSQQAKLDRAQGEVSVEIEGDPIVTPQAVLTCETGRTILDGSWEIKQVMHTIDGNGYRTAISGGAQPDKKGKHYAKPTKFQRF